MSATSRALRGTSRDSDAVAARTGAPVTTAPRRSALHDLVATDGRAPGTIARLALGIVMFPHAAQKVFGWFGGYGLEGTYGFFTTKLGLPGVLAATAIACEFIGSLLLIAGAFTRLGAAMIMAVMIGAVITSHLDVGFFMNWNGTQAGEGFEFHLLAIGLCLVTIVIGGGALSVDRWMMKSMRREVRPETGSLGEMGAGMEPGTGEASTVAAGAHPLVTPVTRD